MANHTSSAAILSVISKELHSILSALIGGAKYGIKIRLPHALLMTFMFRHDLSASDKLRRVLQLSFEHASSLAAFATLYKVMLASLKLLSKYVGESDAVSRSFGRILLSTIGMPIVELFLKHHRIVYV
jgi:F0F1-type ATP synthase assembly protein I